MNIVSLDWNPFQITMTTARPDPKRGGTNIVIDKFYVEGSSLTLQYYLSIIPSCRHTRKIRPSKIMQDNKKSTRNMENDKFNGTLDRNNSSSPLSAGEIYKDGFIEALIILINKFGIHTCFYLPDTGKTNILNFIMESHSHTVSLVQQ